MKNKKMNILLMATHLRIGGIASYTVSLAKGLARRGHRPVVVSSGGGMEKELANGGVTHIKVDIQTKSELSPKVWLNLGRFASIIKSEKIDLIHAQTRVTQVIACVLSKTQKKPYVSTCHGFFKTRLSRRLFDCWGESVIAISETVKDHLINDFAVAQERVELIHNGVDISRFDRKFHKEEVDKIKESLGLDSSPVVGTIGRLSPVKGIGDLIFAFGDSPLLKEKTNCVIVGDGPEKEKLMKYTASLDIADKVYFVPSDPDTPRLLSVMDVFVFPSVQEGLGLSMLEAMAAGKPVVATDVGGIGTLLKDNQTGLLTQRGDRNELAGAIKKLLDDAELRERLASNASEAVRRDYTLDGMVDRTEALYAKLIKP